MLEKGCVTRDVIYERVLAGASQLSFHDAVGDMMCPVEDVCPRVKSFDGEVRAECAFVSFEYFVKLFFWSGRFRMHK